MRRFELATQEQAAFWEVEQKGPSISERSGEGQQAGQSRVRAFRSADEAVQALQALIREKLALGYQEAPTSPRTAVQRPSHYGNLEPVSLFRGLQVREFLPELGLERPDRYAYGVRTDAVDGPAAFLERLDALLADPRVGHLQGLVIGNWFGRTCESPPLEAVERLMAAKERLAALGGLFIGDVVPEEADISTLLQADLTPLIQALPALDELVVRGGRGLRFAHLDHDRLRTLIVQTGGMPSPCVHDLMASQLPRLERVALWLGAEEFGADFAIEDLGPALAGEIWPGLQYLGLMDSDQADGIASAAIAGTMLKRIRALDLSMGTLSDLGGRDLFSSQEIRALSHLNLRHHYMSRSLCASFAKLGIDVDVSDRELDDDVRTCEVSE